MKNDGVLTSKDFFNQKKIEKKQDKPASFPKDVQIERRYMFTPAPMGKAHTTIFFDNKPMKIELIDKIYTPPNDWDEAKRDKFHKVIQIFGFLDKSRVIGKKEIPKEKKKNFIYKVGHPDNTTDEKVKGKVAITIENQEYQFTLEDGIVETKDEKVYKTFIKKGWYEVSVKEIPVKKIKKED